MSNNDNKPIITVDVDREPILFRVDTGADVTVQYNQNHIQVSLMKNCKIVIRNFWTLM